jgi:3-dehydroquinate dehydratase/shikimate dehydrogenase
VRTASVFARRATLAVPDLRAARANRVAVSLAATDTEACLETLHSLAPHVVGFAEVRLDLMREFDVRRLVAGAPCPLVVTCRPPREGGRFAGSERERLAVLREAVRAGSAWVDVEWDTIAALPRPGRGTRLVVSRHFLEDMPASLLPAYQALRPLADAVKLVGHARRPEEALPVLELLRHATSPVVAIAMGAAGRLTRLLAPTFPACLFTYGAADATSATAPGQISVREMTSDFGLDRVGPRTPVHVHLAAGAESAALAAGANAASPGGRLHVPVEIEPAEASAFAAHLARLLPGLTLTADAVIGLGLPPCDPRP